MQTAHAGNPHPSQMQTSWNAFDVRVYLTIFGRVLLWEPTLGALPRFPP